MQTQTIQYAVCPLSPLGGYVGTEVGVQMFIEVADRCDPQEARARQAQINAAYGWTESLLIERGRVA